MKPEKLEKLRALADKTFMYNERAEKIIENYKWYLFGKKRLNKLQTIVFKNISNSECEAWYINKNNTIFHVIYVGEKSDTILNTDSVFLHELGHAIVKEYNLCDPDFLEKEKEFQAWMVAFWLNSKLKNKQKLSSSVCLASYDFFDFLSENKTRIKDYQKIKNETFSVLDYIYRACPYGFLNIIVKKLKKRNKDLYKNFRIK